MAINSLGFSIINSLFLSWGSRKNFVLVKVKSSWHSEGWGGRKACTLSLYLSFPPQHPVPFSQAALWASFLCSCQFDVPYRDLKESLLLQKFGLTKVKPLSGTCFNIGRKAGRNEMGMPLGHFPMEAQEEVAAVTPS